MIITMIGKKMMTQKKSHRKMKMQTKMASNRKLNQMIKSQDKVIYFDFILATT